MSFADKVKNYSDNAPEAGFSPVNFGRLETVINVLHWHGKGEAPDRFPYEEDYELKKGETLEINFIVHISELNPALTFEYERKVNIQKSGRTPADWDKIVLPSLVKVFGDKWADIVTGKKAVYVAVEDIPTVTGATTKDKTLEDGTVVKGQLLGVPKFIAKFKDLNECKTARDERFGPATAEAVEEDDEAEEVEVPKSVVKQVKSLYDSMGKNLATTKKMLEAKPFGEYEADALISAAGLE